MPVVSLILSIVAVIFLSIALIMLVKIYRVVHK